MENVETENLGVTYIAFFFLFFSSSWAFLWLQNASETFAYLNQQEFVAAPD